MLLKMNTAGLTLRVVLSRALHNQNWVFEHCEPRKLCMSLAAPVRRGETLSQGCMLMGPAGASFSNPTCSWQGGKPGFGSQLSSKGSSF